MAPTPTPQSIGNPTPLGLVTFGLSTLLLSFAYIGLYPANAAPIIAQALFVGGLVQMLSGIMEFVKGNTFGSVVFSSFGGFWIVVGLAGILPNLAYAAGTAPVADSSPVLATFLLLWGIYVFLLFLGIYKGMKMLTVVVGTLWLLLVVLAIAVYTGSDGILKLGGVIGVICGGSALYLGAAITLAETNEGKKVLPF
jgi:succinate-acetate transporter protein